MWPVATIAALTWYLSIIDIGQVFAVETPSCNAKDIARPDVFGTEVTGLQAQEVRGWKPIPPFLLTGVAPPTELLDFCNVTVTYTHPGTNDSINVYVWLPLTGWNERFLGQGGSGWAAGAYGVLAIDCS